MTKTVREFYEEYSFPGYEEIDTLSTLVQKAEKGGYAKLLDRDIPPKKRVLDLGCGTGQLAIFLSLADRYVMGADLSFNSLKKGVAFKRRFELNRVDFCEANLFHLPFRDEAFDFIFCNGVLHHTPEPYRGFQEAVRLVKPGGHLFLGLYNSYGRLALDLRRCIFHVTKSGWLRNLDGFMRKKELDPQKKFIWFKDQYEHPHETKHTVDEVLGWFRANGLQFVNALPPIRFGETFDPQDPLFQPKDPGTGLDHLLSQLGWIFTKGREGGFFILIGKKE